MDDPVFYYDLNSPYAYLAASRIDELMPTPPQWQPVAFAFILRALDRTPWSFNANTREPGPEECERRAADYGLPLKNDDRSGSCFR